MYSLAVIVFAYFGGYLVLSNPAKNSYCRGGGCTTWMAPDYLFVGDAAEGVFEPLEMFDRRMRPDFWATKQSSYDLKLSPSVTSEFEQPEYSR
jgi:hypothetical protein